MDKEIETADRKLRALIVEDEPAILEIYTIALETGGFAVERAVDGVAGLDKAIHADPDVIVLDLLMPVKDGFEVLRDLKANPKTAGIPVVVMSNLDKDFERRRGELMGAACYYSKTEVDQSQLASLLRSVIAGQGCRIGSPEF